MPDTEELLEHVLRWATIHRVEDRNLDRVRADIEAYVQAREAPLREAVEEALGTGSLTVHQHFDYTLQHGAGCLTCQTNLRLVANLRAALQREEAQRAEPL